MPMNAWASWVFYYASTGVPRLYGDLRVSYERFLIKGTCISFEKLKEIERERVIKNREEINYDVHDILEQKTFYRMNYTYNYNF